MAEAHYDSERLAELTRENAKLHGEIVATGIILTQLLQSICRTQLNPTAFAAKIMNEARTAVGEFAPAADDIKGYDECIKDYALETVEHYDEQIRSVLPV